MKTWAAVLRVLVVLVLFTRTSTRTNTQDGNAALQHGLVGSMWFERYAALHADIMRGAVPDEQRRFLVWSCRPMGVCGGLGNRMVNIVAAFALAVLTDRAFIIDYPGMLHAHISKIPAAYLFNYIFMLGDAVIIFQSLEGYDSNSSKKSF